MNDPVNRDETSFAAALRQLRPSVEGLSAEETFYQAGWNAALRANARTRRREIRGFAVGIVCGLACWAAGMQFWSEPAVNRDETADHDVALAELDPQQPDRWRESEVGRPRDVAPDENRLTGSAEGGLDEILALVSPGRWLLIPDGHASPSPAAWRRSVSTRGIEVNAYRRLAQVSNQPEQMADDTVPDHEAGERRRSLRAFPLSSEAIDEWL